MHDIEILDQEIKATEERLKYLNTKKAVLNQDNNCIKMRGNELEYNLKKIAYQLCNSFDHKKDLLKLSKTS